MADFTLTTGSDTVTGTASNDTVTGTAATLNPGDSLTGGTGTDVLALYGSGTFQVDQLAAFTGFESITLNNISNGGAFLYLGSQPIAVTGYGSGDEELFLGSGAVTFFQGDNGPRAILSTSASNWNAGNVIDGASSQNTYLYLNWGSDVAANATYDLTTNTLTDIGYLYGRGDNLTLKINSADAAGVANFNGQGTANLQLTTSDPTLDLSHSSVSGFRVSSTDTAGTTFTVQDIGTALQIAGGPGQDTITTNAFVFTPDQRAAIFTTASVERIVDSSGTYTPSPPIPNVFTLTTGSDTVTGTASNDTVTGTAATLNPGDSLTGGTGTDVLALYGSGTFQVDQLAAFTGFESITLNNISNGGAFLYLGSQPIAVTGYGSGDEELFLGSGAVTFFQGDNGPRAILSTSASNWNAGNVIDGASSQNTYLYLNWGSDVAANATYDLTTNTLTDIGYLYGRGDNLTLKINSADAAGVANFNGQGTANLQLTTSDPTLDLSHSSVSGFRVSSTDTAGTTFTVQDIGTALQIAGGPGQDTITTNAFVFTPDQRAAIFTTASVERIVDASGTYTSGNVNEAPTAVALTNATASILEDTPTATHIKVADINVTDDALGSNILALTGADAAFFEIVGSALYLKAGTVLDFESKTSYAVAVTVDDPTVGATPDATSTTYALNVSNVPGVTITGTSAANTIDATHTVAGQPLPTNEEDTINAGGGNDTINALGGNDFINGGAGADRMFGGTGNDTYVVDNKSDVANETGGNGLDTVQSSITFDLSDAVHAIGAIENLTLTGIAKINGTGNALANEIIGNSGNNILNGLGGADTLTGGQGSDKFVFTALAHSTPSASDLITDFVTGSDIIDLSTIDANTSKGGNQAFAFGGHNAHVVANSVTWFESNGNTIVQADANGDTTADFQVVLLGTNLNLHLTDFIL